jgi:hypothetical protein
MNADEQLEWCKQHQAGAFWFEDFVSLLVQGHFSVRAPSLGEAIELIQEQAHKEVLSEPQ